MKEVGNWGQVLREMLFLSTSGPGLWRLVCHDVKRLNHTFPLPGENLPCLPLSWTEPEILRQLTSSVKDFLSGTMVIVRQK